MEKYFAKEFCISKMKKFIGCSTIINGGGV